MAALFFCLIPRMIIDMKTQVLVIHGGNSFDTYEEYIDYLKKRPLTLDHMRTSDWKSTLQQNLGEHFDVLLTQMPNNRNSQYSEWKIWFERIVELLNEKVIFIGHSLGGIFLAKYLSEERYPKRIIATLLVAAPYNTPTKHPLADFNLSDDLTFMKNFEKQGGKILIYQDKEDTIVPFSNCEDYKKAISSAELKISKGYNHFNQLDFPELVSDIKKLAN